MLEIPEGLMPKFKPWQIKKYLDRIKTNKATIPGDIPAKIVKNCTSALSTPMTHMINHSIETGLWPDSYKSELITPIGKQLPVETLDQLRPIPNLPTCDKIQEAIISEMVISDMKSKLDPTQFGNQRHASIQHYLLKMMHRIVTSVDKHSKGEINAIIALFIDRKSAYSNRCHKFGVKSFIKNGMRPSLIPLIINYFQNWEMKVKLREQISQSQKHP